MLKQISPSSLNFLGFFEVFPNLDLSKMLELVYIIIIITRKEEEEVLVSYCMHDKT